MRETHMVDIAFLSEEYGVGEDRTPHWESIRCNGHHIETPVGRDVVQAGEAVTPVDIKVRVHRCTGSGRDAEPDQVRRRRRPLVPKGSKRATEVRTECRFRRLRSSTKQIDGDGSFAGR